MAAKGLPKIRAGMGDVDAPVVEAWSDDDYRRATSLGTILSPDGKADRAGVPALEAAALRECYRTMLRNPRARASGRRRARGRRIRAMPPRDAGVRCGDRRRGGGAGGRRHRRSGTARDGRGAVARPLGRGPGRGRRHPARARRVARSPHGATQLPHATGIAWAMKMQASGKLVLSFLDRKRPAPRISRRVNFAGVFRVPAVFVCINDARRGAAPVETVSETLAVKALAYGIAAVASTAMICSPVHAATRAAADRARKGAGPTLIEAVVAGRAIRWNASGPGSPARTCWTPPQKRHFAARSRRSSPRCRR
jgi:hypothetical protein